jgi:hypothetical protein
VAPDPVATELFLTGKSDQLIQRLTKDIAAVSPMTSPE